MNGVYGAEWTIFKQISLGYTG